MEVVETTIFRIWLADLQDQQAVARIVQRLRRLQRGLTGDVKYVGSGISELRIDYGPGYRIYFMRRGAMMAVLLCGGDKSSQSRDIEKAVALSKEWKEE